MKLYNVFQRRGRFSKGTAALLPEAYRKFYKELTAKPTAVHYIPKDGKWERNELTGITTPVQNVPLPLIYTPERHNGISIPVFLITYSL